MPRRAQFSAEDVVEAAFELVRKNGLTGLSAPAVAAEMGCSTMPIYSHFKNMQALEDEVAQKAWKLAMSYQAESYTDDIWVDQAIGWVRFARDEENLFKLLFDNHNPELQLEMQKVHWEYLAELLEGYDGFRGMDEELGGRVRFTHAMLTHGLATSPNQGMGKIICEDDKLLFRYLTIASQALLVGYKDIPPLEKEYSNYVKEKFKSIMDM